MSKFDVTLVTYRHIPDLTPDDQRLARELTGRGLRVRAAVWSDPDVNWAQSTLTLLRSTWDYFRRPAEFLDWLQRIETLTRVLNSPALIRWNHHKHYLDELRVKGLATVPTLFADRDSPVALADAVTQFATTELVIKPAIGGASYGARRFALGHELGEAQTHLEELVAAGTALIQPFLSSVLEERERSLIFFAGSYSHAYLKPAFSAGGIAGQGGEIGHQPSPAELGLAHAALDCLSERPSYARVDMALLNGEPYLMEFELIEPALQFHLAPGSEARLADVIEPQLGFNAEAPLGNAA